MHSSDITMQYISIHVHNRLIKVSFTRWQHYNADGFSDEPDVNIVSQSNNANKTQPLAEV